MPAQQQDYILRHIQTISRLVARLRLKGKLLSEEDRAEVNETLQLALDLQERNFGMPASRFLALSADEQFATLTAGLAKDAGHTRCLVYVALLRETAELYAWRDASHLAVGARQLALYIAVRVALDQPADPTEARGQIRDLRRFLDGAPLYPPTQDLLEQFDRSTDTIA